MNIDTNNEFIIKQINNSIFQIGDLDGITYDYIFEFSNILNLGNKFIPCFHFNQYDILKNLILSLNDSFLSFNTSLIHKMDTIKINSESKEQQFKFDLDFFLENCFFKSYSLECFFKNIKKIKNEKQISNFWPPKHP